MSGFKGIENYCYSCGKYAILDEQRETCVYCGSGWNRHTGVTYQYTSCEDIMTVSKDAKDLKEAE